MKIKPLKLEGCYEIQLEPIGDHRGFFMRSYDEKIFEEYGLKYNWVQENHSKSSQKGTIRGLHFQFNEYSETKMVRALHGSIIDFFVDIRKNSPTFGHFDSIELTEENKKMVIIPRGFAHGFVSTSNDVEILYKVDNSYAPQHESGILWCDSDLNINWGIDRPIISDKDSKQMTFREFKEKFGGIEV